MPIVRSKTTNQARLLSRLRGIPTPNIEPCNRPVKKNSGPLRQRRGRNIKLLLRLSRKDFPSTLPCIGCHAQQERPLGRCEPPASGVGVLRCGRAHPDRRLPLAYG